MNPLVKQPALKSKIVKERRRLTTEEVAQAIVHRLYKRFGRNPAMVAKFAGQNIYRITDIALIAKDPVTVAIITIEGGKRPYTGSAVRNPEDRHRPEAGAALAIRRALLDAMRSLKLLKKHAA